MTSSTLLKSKVRTYGVIRHCPSAILDGYGRVCLLINMPGHLVISLGGGDVILYRAVRLQHKV